jgi:hypothetical protein
MKTKLLVQKTVFVFLNLLITIKVNSQEFTIVTVDNNGNVGQYSSIAVDKENNSHIGYYDATGRNLKYAKFENGIWNIETVDNNPGDVGKYAAIITDIINKPSISYFYDGNNYLKLAYKESTNSPFDLITGPSADLTNCKSTSIVLSRMYYCPIVAYFDNNDLNLKLTIFKNSSGDIPIDPFGNGWATEIVGSSSHWLEDISLALDNGDEPHIAYIDVAGTTANLKYAKKNCVGAGCVTQVSINKPTGDGTWNIETVDASGNAGESVSISVGTDNIPQICYYDKNSGDLKYAIKSTTTWFIETIDNAGDVGNYNSIALDEFNNPHISYYDATNGDLKYATRTEGSWNIYTIDTQDNVGQYTSIALDQYNNPHISYYDATNQYLKYAEKQSSTNAQTLYGIIYSGTNAGYLIKIDTQTGDATLISNTGVNFPCVLEYISSNDKLLTSNGSGYPSQGYFIDPNTGTTSLVWNLFSPKHELAYIPGKDVLYAVSVAVNASVLIKLNAGTGEWIADIGVINKGPLSGLAVNPITKIMYGTGLNNLQEEWLFRVDTTEGPPPRETDVARIDRRLTGIAFDGNGKLYATDGINLLTINKSTGEVTQIGPLGLDIGLVPDITFAHIIGGLIPFDPDYWRTNWTPTLWALAELVRDGMPWCPLGSPGCPGGRMTIVSGKPGFPEYMEKLCNILQKIGSVGTEAKSYETALKEFREVIIGIPLGANFNKGLKEQLVNIVENTIQGKQKMNSNDFLMSVPLMKVLNAIELDLRLPKLINQKVDKGKYITFDISKMVWGGLGNVIKTGEISLSVKSDYEVFPASSKFSPSWPFMTYKIDFNGELGSNGFLDLTFFIEPLQFKNQVSSIRVLQLVEGGLVDVTTGWDKSRGTVMARTTHPGTFIILGKD